MVNPTIVEAQIFSSIVFGLTTPTEAAAVGALGGFLAQVTAIGALVAAFFAAFLPAAFFASAFLATVSSSFVEPMSQRDCRWHRESCFRQFRRSTESIPLLATVSGGL